MIYVFFIKKTSMVINFESAYFYCYQKYMQNWWYAPELVKKICVNIAINFYYTKTIEFDTNTKAQSNIRTIEKTF